MDPSDHTQPAESTKPRRRIVRPSSERQAGAQEPELSLSAEADQPQPRERAEATQHASEGAASANHGPSTGASLEVATIPAEDTQSSFAEPDATAEPELDLQQPEPPAPPEPSGTGAEPTQASAMERAAAEPSPDDLDDDASAAASAPEAASAADTQPPEPPIGSVKDGAEPAGSADSSADDQRALILSGRYLAAGAQVDVDEARRALEELRVMASRAQATMTQRRALARALVNALLAALVAGQDVAARGLRDELSRLAEDHEVDDTLHALLLHALVWGHRTACRLGSRDFAEEALTQLADLTLQELFPPKAVEALCVALANEHLYARQGESQARGPMVLSELEERLGEVPHRSRAHIAYATALYNEHLHACQTRQGQLQEHALQSLRKAVVPETALAEERLQLAKALFNSAVALRHKQELAASLFAECEELLSSLELREASELRERVTPATPATPSATSLAN
ncbi:MAG: hypothetical protein MJD61_07080 [Proteobacteria bacterium]|nr:hypothetical protein [Pseudomonadota bacterium]